MFTHDLWHSQIEYLCKSIDLNKKDRAKRYHKSSIFSLQSSIPVSVGFGISKLTIRRKAAPAVHLLH